MIPFPHQVTIERLGSFGTPDPEGADLGYGSQTPTTSAAIAAWIQPRSAREKADAEGTGVNIGDYRIYTPYADVKADDVLVATVGPAELLGRYRIVSVANAAGVSHHLEIGADRAT
jgi:hypothetical protein